jgi:UPF0755 protein
MKKILRWAFALAVVGTLLSAGWMAWYALTPIALAASPLDIHIEPGSSLRAAARTIEADGARLSPAQFTLLGRLLGKASDIKAGSYEVVTGITPWRLLEKLTRGDVTQAEIQFIEGWTFRQMRAALDAHPAVRHDTAGLTERELMRLIGADQDQAEGWFFPDTYLFGKGASDVHILRRAHRMMQNILSEEWQRRDPDLPYASPYEALIMASIVEKETGIAADRALVASVFVNRLRRGMLLQTDPSVIYGLGDKFDGNLRKQDLLRDGPYNTYTRPGLPPSPIAMPGLASVRAALHPARTDYLYFVSRGDGSSHFSRDMDEHNRAVNKYQKRRANN